MNQKILPCIHISHLRQIISTFLGDFFPSYEIIVSYVNNSNSNNRNIISEMKSLLLIFMDKLTSGH
jgi:hypothetical protein